MPPPLREFDRDGDGSLDASTPTGRVVLSALDRVAIARHAHRHLDKAGAYAAQARGNPFVEKHRGPFDNVVGLPMAGVRELLGKAWAAGHRPAAR